MTEDYGKLNVDWFQCRDCLVEDGLNDIPLELRMPCSECLELEPLDAEAT